MQRWSTRASLTAAIAAAFVSLYPVESEAGNKSKKALRSDALFDITTRKSTKKDWGASVKGSAYAQVKITKRQNFKRDDGERDSQDIAQAYLGFAARADLTPNLTAFAHAELTAKAQRRTGRASTTDFDLKTKELLLSLALSPTVRISVGRMRFRDADKWLLDTALDGIHVGWREAGENRITGAEVAVIRGTGRVASSFVTGHVWRKTRSATSGALVLAERDTDADRFHVGAYHHRKVSARFDYRANVAALASNTAQGRTSGVGFDVRASYKLQGRLNPQLTFGLAAGSSEFRQTGLQSNKTYDGGQTQMHRYGDVYRPNLNNIAVVSMSYGLRPSKTFSVSLNALAYHRVARNGAEPDAKVKGDLLPGGTALGHEINLASAWRPSKKTKVEFGIGQFKPGSAYADRSSVSQLFARYTVRF